MTHCSRRTSFPPAPVRGLLLAALVLCGVSLLAVPVPLPPPTLETVLELPAQSSDLMSDGAGHLWGVSGAIYAGGDVTSYGTIFRVDERTGAVATLVTFTGSTGATPGVIDTPIRLTFVPGASGAGELWGIGHSVYDASTGAGAGFQVFCVDAATGAFTRLKADTGATGAFPYSNPTEPLLFVPTAGGAVGAGFVWGTTLNGGADDYGVLFRIATTGARALTKVAEFKLANGHIAGELAADAKGVVWIGTLEAGDDLSDSFYFTATSASTGLTQAYAFSSVELAEGLQAASLRFVPEGANGKFWAVAPSAIYHIDAATKALVTVASGLTNDDGAVVAPFADPAGVGGSTLWGVAAGVLFQLTGDSYDQVTDLNPPGQLSGLFAAPTGNFYAIGHFGDPNTADELHLVRFGPSPVTLPADVAGTSALLHATVNPQGLATTAHLEYGTDPALATFTTGQIQALGNGTDPVDLSLALTNLSQKAAYYYRIIASNAANASAQSGAIVGFSTSTPLVTTGGVAGLDTDTVTLAGTANPQGAPTSVNFEYGADLTYGDSTPPVDVGSGIAILDFQAPLTDLTPHATYHYRAVAENASFTAVGADAMFTVPNHAPTAQNLTLTTPGSGITFDVAEVAEDADDDTLTVQVMQGAHGAVTVSGSVVTYTPGVRFDDTGTDHFTYTVNDGHGGSAGGSVGIFSRPVLTSADYASTTDGKLLPGAGTGSILAGALAQRFGPPALNRNGAIAYRVNFATGAGVSGQAIVGPTGTGLGVVAVTGVDLRPQGLPGLSIKSMRDPVLGGADPGDFGRVAFVATLQGPSVSAANNLGLFTNATTDGSLMLVARTGSVPAGFDRVKATALLSLIMDAGSNLYYTVKLNSAPGTDLALANADGPLVRAGDLVTDLDGNDRKVTALAALAGASGTGGAALGYGQTAGGGVLVRAKLAKDGSAILLVDAGGPQVLTNAGAVPDFPDTDNAVYQNFSLPVGPAAPTFLAWLRVLPGVTPATTTKQNNLGVFANFAQALRKGEQADPSGPIVFKNFGNPVGGEGNGLAMIAKINGSGIDKTNNRVLLWQHADGTNEIVAQPDATTAAPGVPDATLKAITAIALPGAPQNGRTYGPLFQGKLAGRGITAKSDDALWATNSAGAVQLVIREGAMIDSGDAAHAMKQVQSFVALRALAGSPAQGRAYGQDGDLALLVQFADGSQAIVRVQLP